MVAPTLTVFSTAFWAVPFAPQADRNTPPSRGSLLIRGSLAVPVIGGGSSVDVLPLAGLDAEDVKVTIVLADDRVVPHGRLSDSPLGQFQDTPAFRYRTESIDPAADAIGGHTLADDRHCLVHGLAQVLRVPGPVEDAEGSDPGDLRALQIERREPRADDGHHLKLGVPGFSQPEGLSLARLGAVGRDRVALWRGDHNELTGLNVAGWILGADSAHAHSTHRRTTYLAHEASQGAAAETREVASRASGVRCGRRTGSRPANLAGGRCPGGPA